MANKKLTDLTTLAETPAIGDYFHIVDVSDTTDDATGTSKKITYDYLVPDAVTLIKGTVTVGTDVNSDYVCDGVADEVQINQALAALTSGGTVLLKKGTYNTAAAIDIPANVTLRGESMFSTIITLTGNYNGVTISGNNASCEDFMLDCDSNGSYYGILKNTGYTHFRAYRVKVIDAGLDAIRVNTGSDHIIRDCILDNSGLADQASPALPSGISFNSLTRFRATGNTCINTTTTANRGVGISASSCTYGYIADNECYSNNYGIDVPYGLSIECTGNTCRNNDQIGIDFSNGGQQNRITDNYCYANGIDGIRCWASDTAGANFQYNVVSNNVCDSNATGGTGQGIYISDTGSGALCHQNVITNNMCMDRNGSPAQEHGILSDQQSNYNVVSGNNCYNNKTANLTLAGANNTTTGANQAP